MATINELLKVESKIPLDDLLLDPNNPRFMKHSNDRVAEDNFDSEGVQENAYSQMLEQHNNFEIDELVDAIMADGFMEVDKIFVDKIGDKYLVIEGNRRVTALKTILRKHRAKKPGFEKLPIGVSDHDYKIPCVVINHKNKEEKAQLIRKILGLRHHGSILPWKPLPSSFNLYDSYMAELCEGNAAAAQDPAKFEYRPPIAKKVAAMFSVKLSEVRSKVRLYRTYLQLLSESRNSEKVARPESFSMIEETVGSRALRARLGYSEQLATFSEEGIETVLDLYYGLKGKPEVIVQASAGNSNVRDFGYVVSEGTEEDLRRIVEGREPAQAVRSDVAAKRGHRNLQSSLELVYQVLGKINLGEIGFEGLAPIELQHLEQIQKKLDQLRDAAKPRK